MKIQGQKIYIGNKNLLDIESIYENHPEITCRFLIEENLAKENVENKIKEALQNYPKLSGLNFQVKINEENKIVTKEKKETEENNTIKNLLESNDKIYFDLDLKEVWLNVDLSITELTETGKKIVKLKDQLMKKN